MFAGVSVIASASSITNRSVSLKGAKMVIADGAQFLIAKTSFSAHGRIDVYSEGATDARRGSDSSELEVAQ